MEVTAVFQGITTPVSDLYNEIHMRGWQVTKVDIKDGQFVAQASNPQGEQAEKAGRDPNTALGALLMYIMRREHIRQGAWNTHWADQLESVAKSYAKAPHFDPKAATAWKELADDCVARAAVLSHQLAIEVTHDPEPYGSPQELWEDVQKKRHLYVSDAASEHPVWTRDQVIAFRICHDVLGHAAAGGDFGWTGENLATAAHMPYLTPNAQHALFTETVGQAAYNNYYRGYGPQKITFLKDHLEPVQETENPAGHGGEHPQMSLVPGELPTRSSGVLRDPNYQYETNIVPPTNNAITAYGDPLQHMTVKDGAHALDTGWARFEDHDGKPDVERMKVAVTNALRAALLSPLKELKWNAVHYQDLSHIPYHVSDPKVYWDALENARINHNRAQGFPDPEIRHKQHYESLLDFYRYYARHNPQLNPSESKAAADREVMVMQAEIEEDILNGAKDTDLEIIAPKVTKELDKRLKQIVRDDKPLHTAAVENPYEPNRQAYGAFIGRYLVSIAQVSKYADLLTEAALEDVKRHDGAGHVFRAMALRLGIPYVGPKVVSFAWLLLQPLTSQLATIDSHMADVLGYKYKDVANNRDYFRLERELQAGRDASGYSHMPLGQFQWAMWDHKRTGLGTHQDHTPLRPWEPTPHHQVEWKPKIPANQNKNNNSEWVPPEWWAITQPHREAEAAAWAHDVAVQYPKAQYPWTDAEASMPHIGSEESADEVHLAIDVPEWVRKKIAEYVGTLNIAPERIIDPNEYHITVAYAPHGVNEISIHEIRNSFNLTGLKFVIKTLTKLGDAGALVIELENDDFDEYATRINEWLEEEYGIEVSHYDSGYTPHITVAYTEGDDAPTTKPPLLTFRGGPLSFSTPRKADALPSLWAKYISHRLASLDWECKTCHHNFGEHKPDFGVMKYCPGCGSYLNDQRVVQRKDPNQMELDYHAGQPPEVKWMRRSDVSNGFYDDNYRKRLPTGYDSLNNIMYVGPVGIYHADLGHHFGIPIVEGEYGNALTDNAEHMYVGYINLAGAPEPNEDYPDLTGAALGWYHRTPSNAEAIEQAVIPETPAGVERAKTEDEEWEDLDDFDFDLGDTAQPEAEAPQTEGEFVPAPWSLLSEIPNGTKMKTPFTPVVYTIAQQGDYTLAKWGNDETQSAPYPAHEPIPDSWKFQVPEAQPQANGTFGSLANMNIGDYFESTNGATFKVLDTTNGLRAEVISDHPSFEPGKVVDWPKESAENYAKTVWKPVQPSSDHPATYGDAPEGSVWKDGNGAVYKVIKDQWGNPATILLKDSSGNINPGGNPVPYAPTQKFPETFQPVSQEWGQASGGNPWEPFEESQRVQHSDYPGHEFEIVDVTEDETPKAWLLQDLDTQQRFWTEQNKIIPEGIQTPQAQPQQQQPSPWKIGDLAVMNEEKWEEHMPYSDPDTTVYKINGFGGGKAQLLSPHDNSITEVPEDWLEKPSKYDQVAGEQAHGITNEQGQPPSLTGDHHAVFAITTAGDPYRVSDWTDWGHAIDQYNAHDDKHVPPYTGNSSYITVPHSNGEVKSYDINHFGVRSGGDPGYNTAQYVTPTNITHPSNGTFSHTAQRLKRCTKCKGPLDVKGVCLQCGKHHYGSRPLASAV